MLLNLAILHTLKRKWCLIVILASQLAKKKFRPHLEPNNKTLVPPQYITT